MNRQDSATTRDDLIADRFLPIRKVGTGATADVYEAQDLSLNRVVALKIIHPRLMADPVLTARVRAEVALARDLAHESIVTLYEYLTTADRAIVVMEYMPGGDLRRQILLSGHIEPARVTRLARAILSGLEHAHERGVVHRDVKPRNVLFDSEGNAKLSDFGLARSMSSAGLTDSESVAGTPEYTAPETITASLWDPRSDLYGVGCTLYEALTGRPPFQANTPAEVLRLQVEAPIPSLPKEMEREHTSLAILITALMAKNPNERPQSASEALRLLDEGRRDVVGRSPTRRCPSCGAPMSAYYDWCFTCRKPSLPAVAVRSGGITVMVTGPGKPGEKIAAGLRDACNDAIAALGLHSERMAKQVPRLPFVLARKLDSGSAVRLQSELVAAGLEVSLFGEGQLPRRKAARLVMRKVLAMAPRLYLVLLGTTGGTWQIYSRIPPAATAAILGTFLVGIPIVMSLIYRSGLAKAGETPDGPDRPQLNQLLGSVDDPLIHARVRNIVEAGAVLLETAEQDEATSELRDDLKRFVEESIEKAASLGTALSRIKEGAGYARHTAALSQRSGGTAMDESVAVVRKMDYLYTRALEMIGRVALNMHSTAVRLARGEERLSRSGLRELQSQANRLADKDAAWTELESSLVRNSS